MRWRPRSGSSKGFSMVELTVTMLLVGILAAIVIPKLLGPRVESKNTEAKTTLQTAFTSARGYKADTRDYGNLCADDIDANLCANKTSLHSLSQSVGDAELPDDATPSDSKGAPPGAIWMGNGETGADPIAGDSNSGKTIVLCTLVEGGDTVYCIKDDNGKIKYAKEKGEDVTVASVGNGDSFSATTDLNGKTIAQSSADTGQGQVAVEEPPLNDTPPSITGPDEDEDGVPNTRRDETLTGSPGSWSGRPTPTYTYQWQRCDSQGSGCSDIAGATSSAYTLVIADVGKRVQLKVTASNTVSSTDNAVNATSAASEVVADPVMSDSAPLNQVAPALTGQTTVGSNIITDDGIWEGTPAPDFSYQWRRCDLTGSNCVVMTGVTGSTYTLTSDDAAHTIRSRVTATNVEGSASQLSAARGPISQQPLNVVAPSVSGNVAAGNTVTVDVGSWSGYPDPTFTYQWKRCDTAGLSCQLLDGATSSDYSLTNADSGSTLRITVTASNVAGSSSATSAASSSVEGAPENTSAPVISGTTSLAETLSASRGSWAGTPAPTYSYQWQRCDLDGANCQSITSANSSTYQLTRTDGGSDIKVRVTATNSNGTANAYSSATSAVRTIPLNTTRPAVSGSTEIGGQITSSSGSWDAYPVATYAYQWQRCNSAGASCADISSATSNTYTVQASDANSTVRSVVTATNSEGSVASESEVTAYVSRPPVNTSPPAISGTLRVGQTLTATSGAWSNNPDSYAYQWQRCYNGDCSDITGATSGTYLLVDDDTAMNMRVLVIASNGSGSAQAYSDSSDPVARAPLNTAAPTITGTAAAGQTLTVDNGGWKAYPVPTYTYQWQRCDSSGSSCSDITDATSATYQLTSDDIGITVKAKVRASNSEGSSTAISAASDIVGSPPTSVALPAVTGTNKVGFSLSSSAGTWAGYPTPTIQYQWRRCDGTGVSCTDINGATLASYTLASADAGKTIISRVTATNISGSATADSAATDFVLQTPENNAAPAITGTAQVGSSLSASSGSWAAYPTATYAYQWQISADGSTGWASATGTGSTTTGYTPVSSERGQFLRIKVTASNSAGSTAAYSDATTAIKQIPVNTALPAISGSVQVGSTLTTSSGSWTAFPTPTYAYQWQVSADGSIGWAPASGTGSTTASYAIAAADAGKYLRVTVAASNSAGSSSADSAVTGMVLDPPANSSAPTIVGAPQVGVVSTSTSGSWTGIPTPTYSYQWQVSSDGSTGWTSATGSGAATSSYTPASVDSGKYLRLQIIASNLAGAATAYSAVSSAVLELPSNTATPIISGTVKVGLTVTVSSGTWSAYPTPTYSYQWQTSADGSTGWASATGTGNSTASYTIPNSASQPGLYLRVRVTATNAAGAVTASSSNSRIIGLFNTSVPALSGTSQVGQTLTSTSGDWSSSYPSPTYSYQWQVSTDGATGWASAAGTGNATASYTVATTDTSKYLRMQVTATNTAGTDSSNSAVSAQVTQLPVNNSVPAISGTARAGQALSGASGSWDGYPAPTYAYQWQVSADGSTGWTSAAGSGNATASYTAAVADVSKYLRLKVTATNSVGSVAAYSAASSQVDQTPVNTALPTITGTVQVGQALTSSSGSWDGYPALSYSYQWQVSSNGSTGWASATGSGNATASYTAVAADAGKFLRSKVTATNTAGSDIAYSDATVAVKQTPSNTTLPAVSGTAQVGQNLTASSGSWDGYPAPTYAYQWQVSANGTTGWSSATGAGNTTASYAVPSADAGKYLRVNVTASNSAGSSSAASATTSMVTETPANTALPALSGTAEIATTVSSSSGTWTGTPTPSITYQWQSSDDDAAWSNIASATASSYAIPATSAWIGKYIRVRVTGTNSAGADTVSSSSRHITGLLMSSSPTVAGTAQSGEALTAAAGAWTSYPVASYAYQWQVSADGTTGWASATGTGNATSSYTVAAADASKYLRIQVTASNGVSSNVVGTSAVTSRVTQKPVNTALPVISGTPGSGVTLTVSSGSWDSYPLATYAYQWQRCSSAGASCVDISGATSSSYLLALADNGQTVRAVVAASNSVGPTAANSAVTAIIVMEPVNSALPTISGTARKGSTLTATNGSWSNSPSSYIYQWQRCSPAGASCVDVSGATSSTYLLLTADVNHRLLAKVTAANAYGSNTASSAAYSNTLQAPENTSTPTISGTLAVGSTLTGSAGSWDALPTATYEYQWQRSANGSTGWSSITSATSSTYVLQVADSSQYLRLLVAATNSEGSASAQSAVTAQVGQAPSNTVAPAVSGTANTGSTLTSTSGSWDGFPAPSYAYQWQSSADGSTGWADISSATNASYIIAATQASKYLRVKVTATNSSGSASAYSSASSQVRQLPTLTASPALSGTAQVGQTLSVSAGSWDGFPTPSQSYQWQTSPSGTGSWTDLSGANSASYTLLTAQAGLYMRAVITASNSVGSTAAPSASSAVIVQAPANTALPAVSGTATVGGSLTASSGAWNGYPLPAYAYQWQVSNDGSTGWTSATGTGNASSSYVPAAADASKYLRVQVVATNSVSSATANSAATSVVTQSPVNTVAPGISGTTQVAIPVAATAGTWTAYPVASYAYQWQVSANGSSGWASATGSGSTTSSYTPANADIGQYLRIQVTASNVAGSAAAYSSAAAVNGPPVNVSLPVITGTASSGSVLSVSSGSWSGYPTPAYAYQWQVSANGSTAWTSASGTGNTSASYTVAAGDAGKYLRAQVTATNAAGTAAASSVASSQITQLPVNNSVPTVSGTARAGQSLSGASGSWDGYPAPTYAYQWQVSADGSTGWASAAGTGNATSSYTVAVADISKYLRLKVTATNSVGSVAAYSVKSAQVDQTPVNNTVPSITGTAQVSQTLTSSSGSWDGYPAITYSYQWQTSADGSTGWSSSTGSGNATSSYTVAAADAGKYLRVRVTAANSAGSTASYSAASSPASQSPANTAIPTITGSAQVGSALTSSSGSWDGYPAPTYAYQWQVSADGSTSWTSATGTGNTTASYTVIAAEAGKYLRVRVTATNSVDSAIEYSNNTASIIEAPSVVSNPSISGSAVRGSTLTASDGSWRGTPTPTLSRVWYRCSAVHASSSASVPADCAVIDAATASTYVTVAADDNNYVAVKVTAANSAGSASRISATTALIGTAPVISVEPSISGSAVRPTTLSASDGSADGTPTPTVASRAWYRCTASSASAASSLPASCSLIAGETASTYVPVDADNANYIMLAVTYSNSFSSLNRYSASTASIKVPSSCSTPTISGSFTTGGSTSASASCSGSPTPSVSYQWQVSADGSTSWTSATGDGNASASYTVASADAGKYLRVRVSASNSGGSTTANSAASEQITQAAANTALPAITGTARSGQSLSASSGSWDGFPAPTYAYQWQTSANGSTGWTSATGAGNATSSYTASAGDAGNYLRVQVTATNSVNSAAAYSDNTASVTAAPVNTSLPSLSGTTIDGQTLTASSGSWTGIPTPTYAYQWQVSNDGSTDWASAIGTGNGTASYAIAASDVGKYLRVQVTATNSVSSVSANSSASAQVTASTVAPANTSLPAISGTASTGQALTASSGSWTGTPTPTYAYQWQTSANGTTGWTSAAGTGNATSSYTVAADDAGNYLRVQVTATNSVGLSTSSSAATSSVTSPPANTVLPAVTGTARSTQTLTASSGTWTGIPTPTYAYQWQVSVDGSTGWTSATGTGNTTASYTVAAGDAGNYLRVQVTATNSVSSVSAASAATSAVTALPANTVLPAVSGTASTGSALTASSGTWTGTPTPTYAYQWQTSANGTTGWASATGSGNASASYTVAAADAGNYLRVQVTATNSAGSSTVASAATASVTAAPINTATPVVTGTASSTQTLTASSGSWTGTPTPTYAYQWQTSANGTTGWASATGVGNATSSYTVAAGDAGNYLRVQVTATNSVSSVTASSSATASVTAAPINTALPAVSGAAQVDSSLSASSGSWTGTPTPTYAYQWQTSANGTTGWASAVGVGNATSSYTVAAADAGKYLRVQVSATNSVSSVTASSAASAAVTQAAACSTPSFSGTPGSGQVLLASASCTGTPTPTLTYQWQTSADGSTGWASATGTGNATASYTVASGDAGNYIRVTVTGTNSSSSASASSSATRIYLSPANTSVPIISGTAQSGQTLNATSGSWTGYPAPTYAYQWQVSADGSTGWASAAGSGYASASYVATSADAGKYLRVSVTATNSGGSTAAQSAASARLTGLPTNTAVPAISGTAQAGQDLTATSGSWTGYPTPAYDYQWQVSADGSTSWTSATGTGATTTTYTAATADAGKYLRVQVTATNSVGSGAPAYSANSSLVAARPAPVNTALPAVSGSVQTGQILSATAGSWNHSPSSYAYQWQTSADGTTGWASATGSGNATASYTVASADAGNYLRVQVTATNESGSTAAQSAATSAVTALPINTAVPAVSGSVVRGSSLTASDGTWTGSPSPTYTTSWYRCDTTHTAAASLAGDCSVIASATLSTYTTVSADDGKFIAAQITATNSSGSASYVSATTAAITYLSCTTPIVTGTARSGQTLSTTNTCSGTPAPSVSYQWQTSADGSTGWASATGSGNSTSSYTVASGDAGKYLRVQITGTNTAGSSTVYSAATASVTAAPINTVLPSVTGTASTGSALTAASGTWTGTPTPTYAYQWQVSADGSTGWAAATGTGNATSSYTVAAADAGNYLRVQVTATNSVSSVVATSSATSAVTALPVNTVAPAVSGSASSTQTLAASSGTWTGTPTPTYAYQWQTSSNGTTGWTSATGVGSATSSYTVASGDTGNYLRVQVTATNGAGSVPASSAATSAVTAAPINTALPAVSGTASSTQTLLASSGTWTGTPTPTYAYQWQTSADGSTGWASATGVGNTTASYTVAAADAGNYLRVQVTAANTAGSVTAASAATASVTAAPINTVLPSVTGTASTGSALTAASGTWTGTPTPTYAYQWQISANGTTGWTSATGSGNTTASYTVASADASNYLRVQVTATNSVSAVAASSAATAAVTAGPANTAAPSVSGSVVRGSTLTATNGTWTGTPTPTYATAWYRCATTHTAAASLAGDCSVIASATLSTYTTVAADDGKFIAAQITATNSSGPASYVSATTAAITYLSCTTPVITGTVAAGQVISTTNTCSGTPTPAVSYQWQISADGSTSWTPATGPTTITGTGEATTASYTVPAGDGGKFLRVQITGSNTAGSSTVSSASIQFTQAPVNTVVPVIAGTTTPGSVLTASSGTWTAAPAATYSYQWMRCDLNGLQCANVGTNSSTYTLVNADAAYTIKVQVTASNAAGSAAASSTATAVVASASGCTLTTSGLYTIHSCTTTGSNTLNTYRSLSANYLIVAGGGGSGGNQYHNGGGGGGGMLEGTFTPAPTSYPVVVGAGGAATGNALQGGNGGNSSVFGVTTTGGGGSGQYSNNSPTPGQNGGSGGGGGGANGYNQTGGTGIAGQGFAGGNANLNNAGGGGGAGGVGETGSDAGNYGGNGGPGRSSSITGTATFYAGGGGASGYNGERPGAGGVGGGGAGNSTTGNPGTPNTGGGAGGAERGSATNLGVGGSGIVIVRYLTAAAPANTALPTVAGNANKGVTLTGTAGTWTGEPTPTLTYQWQVATAATGATWSSATGTGATSLSYTPASADVGQYLRLTVTGTSTSGVITASSAASSMVTDKPINTVLPVISGAGTSGSVLNVSTGTWTGAAPITYSYQWQTSADGSTGWANASGSGSTSNAYTVAAGDGGKYLRVTVGALNSTGSGSPVITASFQAPLVPANTVVPVIAGTTTPGQTLTATSGTWTGTPTPTYAYQWTRCDLQGNRCTSIGTNSSSYTLVNADASYTIKVQVTASNAAGSAAASSTITSVIASASGGTVTSSGGYTIHTFTTAGANTFSNYRTLTSDYLVVGGGGGGGGSRGGGGGAGGMRTGSGSLTGPYNYAITVGAGGTSANGGDSSLINTTAGWSVTGKGGGKGGPWLNAAGSTGGSGGGNGGNCCSSYLAAVAGTPGQGNAGGPTASTATDNPRCASGGGGAGGVGIGSCNRADGGPGLASSITGASVTYAGGGGGAVAILCGEGYGTNTAGVGGSGGGSGAACSQSGSTAGTNGLGGGGGAGGSSPGGSGIVVVRYLTPVVPANTAAPTISGTTNSGNVVTGTAGTWTGEPTPTYTYQWQVSANGTTGWSSATGSGATSLNYTVAAADISQYLRLTVTGTSASGITTASSAASSVVTNVPINSAAPTMTGTATVAGSLSASTGSWTGGTPTSYSYQWQVSANGSSGWASATGTGNATATYVPAGVDAGQFLRVSVIANSATGSSAAAYSAATASVTYFPINTVAPAVSGSTLSGQTLAATSGTWTGTPTPTYTYQWQASADGSTGWASATGTGNTSTTYTPAAADASKYLRVAVTGSNVAGSVIAYSNTLGPVQFSVPTLAWSSTPATPVVTGTTTSYGTWTLGGGAASSVQCQTGSGAWVACASTTTNTWTLGAAGSDTVLNVRAINAAGTSATLTRTVHRNYAAPTVSITSAPPHYYYQTGTYYYTHSNAASCTFNVSAAPWGGANVGTYACPDHRGDGSGAIAVTAAQRGGQGWRRVTITVTNTDGSTSTSTTNDWYSGASDVPNGDFQTSALAPYWGDVSGSYGGYSGGAGIYNYNTWLLAITSVSPSTWNAVQQTSGQYNRCDNIYWESSINTYTQANYTYVPASYTPASGYTPASYTAAYSYVSSYSYPRAGKAGFRLWYWSGGTWNLYYNYLDFEGSTSLTSHAAGGSQFCGLDRLITLLGTVTTSGQSGSSYFDNVRGQNAG